MFGDVRFERLSTLANGHLYNMRGSPTYRAKRTVWTRTRPTTVEIALRQAPEPEGRPGHVRVDTVHAWTPSTLGNRDGVKGLFLINLVDEVTQYEFVGAAVGTSRSGGLKSRSCRLARTYSRLGVGKLRLRRMTHS